LSGNGNECKPLVLGAEAALCEVRRGRRVCVIEYGHPTVAAAQSELLAGAYTRLHLSST
jgi:hypothetical protein